MRTEVSTLCLRCGNPLVEPESQEYIDALRELEEITLNIIGCSIGKHKWERDKDRWWECTRCKTREQEVELYRKHPLDRRQWRTPTGEILTEAVNWEAVELLRDNPEEYFRVRSTRLT